MGRRAVVGRHRRTGGGASPLYRWLTPDNCHEDTDLVIGTVIVFCGGVYALFLV